MGNSEGGAESIVLTDAAAPVWITHRPQLCKSWITTRPISVFLIKNVYYHQHMSLWTHFFIKNPTYLRCHTYLLLCRCPACGGDTDIGSWSLAVNKRRPPGCFPFLGHFQKKNQASGAHLKSLMPLILKDVIFIAELKLGEAWMSFCTWWWGLQCHGGNGGCRPGCSDSAAKCRSSLKWSVHWMKWLDHPERKKQYHQKCT